MQEHDLSYVRAEMVLAQAAPPGEKGTGAWIRRNLFATPLDSVLTVLGLLLVAFSLFQAVLSKTCSPTLRNPGGRSTGSVHRFRPIPKRIV